MLPEGLAGFSFLRPWWLLALAPCLGFAWWLARQAHGRSGWEAVLPPYWLALLLQRSTTVRPTPYLTLGLGWCLAVLALAGPAVRGPTDLVERSQASVVVVLDLSRNMLAADVVPSRLELARRKVKDLMLHSAGYQVGLVAFAGSAHRVTPISDDYATLADLIDTLEPGLMPTPGTDVGAGIAMARGMIEELPRRSSAILLITSGVEGTDLQALEAHAAELGPQLAILGVGTAAGSPVALPEGGFMRDAEGRILLPRLDAQALAALARRHGAGYRSMAVSDADLDQLLGGLDTRSGNSDEQQLTHRDVGHWLSLPLLLVAALGLRRGWLGLMLCCWMLPSPAQAAWADWWQKPDQQAHELLLQQRPEQAANRFEDPAWRSLAHFQAQQYERAAAGYAKLVEQHPDDADLHYNYGTALALAGRHEEALEAFEQALTRQPDHQAARHNRAQVEALLERLREEAAAQQPEAADADEAGEPPSEAETGEDRAPSEPAETDPAGGESEQVITPTTPPSAGQPADPLADAASGDISSEAEMSDTQEGDAAPRNTPAIEREQQQAMQQWLEDIPDNPGELLRRKFLHQHMQQRESR